MKHVFGLTESLEFVFLIGNRSDVWACTSIKAILFKVKKGNFLMIKLTNDNYTPILIGRRQWHPTLVLLPGKSHGWRSLVGCSPWGR